MKYNLEEFDLYLMKFDLYLMKFDLQPMKLDLIELKNSRKKLRKLIGDDLMNLAENIQDIDNIAVQDMQVADDEWEQRRKETRSLGHAVACSDSFRGAGELPACAWQSVSWAGTPDAAQEFDAAGCSLCDLDRRSSW